MVSEELWLDAESAHVLVQLAAQFFQILTLFFVAHSDGHSVLACSCGSTNSMDVPLWFCWETKVDDTMHIWNIKTSSNNVSSNQE